MTRETLSRHRIDSAEWVSGLGDDMSFKLLHADADTGHFSLLLHSKPSGGLSMHKHIGTAEVLVLEGYFYYDDDPGYLYTPGTYLFENAGAEHAAVFPQGGTLFAHFDGPFGLPAEDGEIVAIDAQWYIDKWEASGQQVNVCHGPADQQGA